MNIDKTPIDFVAVYYDKNNSQDPDGSKVPYRKWLYSGDALSEFVKRALQYAGWVRNIYIVSVDPLPADLDVQDDRIKVLSPSDFMPPEYSQTRNINAIELNLFRIDGLSEYFVYFSAGIFLCRPVPADYFFKDGLPRDYAVEAAIDEQDAYRRHVLINDILLINTTYNREICKKYYMLQYLSYKYPKGMINNLFFRRITRANFWGFEENNFPLSLLKTSCRNFWNEYAETLAKTCEEPVEGHKDVDHSALRFYLYATGYFNPFSWHGKTSAIRDINDLSEKKTGRAYIAIFDSNSYGNY